MSACQNVPQFLFTSSRARYLSADRLNCALFSIRSGTSPLACLNAMLHSNSRSCDGLFYKLPGRISLFTLKKAAAQWSRTLAGPEGEELDDAESSGSNEAASTVSGDNDVSLDETSSNASCSTESQSKSSLALRESTRTASQVSKQKKKAGMMLPRVVLTPLKVNGAHMEPSSGLAGKPVGDESSSSSSSVLPSTLCNRTEMAREAPHLLRGVRKPSSGQMKRNRGDDVDFETPGSILVNTNLRALINSRTFNALPLHFQQQLLLLLPEVDRQAGTDGLLRLSGSALNNEFFAHAAQSWRERLADGEFTHEMQVRIRQEMEKEKKTEVWKERFFEDYYGQKLGLTTGEPNSASGEAENRTAAASPEGPARAPCAPTTHQPDGHFKRRSLRCRSRRNRHKLREPEASAPAPEASPSSSAEATPVEEREADPSADERQGSRASPPAEMSPEVTRVLSRVDEVVAVAAAAAAAAPDRIPSLPLGPQEQQKRKCFEQTASPSFPEKKPRLEDRQSFRNTIESVHPEKPQPTKEEPKVPPIRIQLSRIKPPWVVKGQPAYQICPRIIPNPEPAKPDRRGSPTSADSQACPLQGRVQRAAATPASTIGGGGGPGGGGRAPDEGGGGGRSSSNNNNSRVRPPRSHRAKHWRSKRTRGKRWSDLQRAQLLPPSHLDGKTGWPVPKANLPSGAREPTWEGERELGGQAASLPSQKAAAQREEPSEGGTPDRRAAGVPAVSPGQLVEDPRPPLSPEEASLEGRNRKERRESPVGSQRSSGWLGDAESRKEGREDDRPAMLDCTTAAQAGSLDLAPESSARVGSEALGSPAWDGVPVHPTPAGTERPPSQPQRAAPGAGRGARSSPEEASRATTGLLPPCFEASAHKSHLSPAEAPLGMEVETDRERAEAGPNASPSSDEGARSPLSETTETASDLDAELTDESLEINRDCRPAEAREARSNQRHPEERKEVILESRKDLPSDVDVANAPCGRKSPSATLTAGTSVLSIYVKIQERPRSGVPQTLSTGASKPLEGQGVIQGLPPRSVLPSSQAAKSRDRLVQDASYEEGTVLTDPAGKAACPSELLRDSAGRPCLPETASLPPEKNPNSGSMDQAVRQSQKTDLLNLGKNHISPTLHPDQRDPPWADSTVGVGKLEEKLKTAPEPRLVTSLGPGQPNNVPAGKTPAALGRKVFGSGIPSGGAAAKAQKPQGSEPFPMWGMLSHSKLVCPTPKGAAPGAGLPPAREGGPCKRDENRKVQASVQRKREPPKEAPAKLREPWQSLPLVRDLAFFKLPKEPGKGAPQPLEPSSLPSQLNIKQAFYRKLSKLQLNCAQLNSASSAGSPFFPRSLEGSHAMPFGPKATLTASSRGGLSFSAQVFAETGKGMEELSLQCSCSLKAMIMCKGCGAFCHDDCIGPSKLCVLCLVVR
ncbi:putative Polycomb group protein ASXL1 [Protobothrops mucrosquamatus]|uniref:putative Polycomb group protein ASXL1 n=1 Tax=Protobothrops mucrosquamatus TaxID=103944 RepID=UPI0010FBA865|nr:putative Polycomb group protein ASXL1 [Protobothrops mucrosquamatus]